MSCHVRNHTRGIPAVILAVGMLVLSGCGGGAGDAPAKFEVTGKVSYAGASVPAGEIVFEPDSSKGNSGPAATGEIRDGSYSIDANRGSVGGPMIVRIIGYDGKPPSGPEAEMQPHGAQLFTPYETTVDLPKSSAEQDFEILKQP